MALECSHSHVNSTVHLHHNQVMMMMMMMMMISSDDVCNVWYVTLGITTTVQELWYYTNGPTTFCGMYYLCVFSL